jgi:hypothetical protein
MNTKTAVAAVLLVFIVAGCTSNEASVSANASSTPAASASPSASVTASPTPAPGPVTTAGPLTVAGEFSFGISDFGGVPYGQPFGGYASALGPTVHAAGCGDENFSSVYPASPVASWELFLIVPWDDPNATWGAWDTKAFLLVNPQVTPLTTQSGPVGPRGLRLGTPVATIEAMFPAEAAATTTRAAGYPPDYDVTITERVFSIANLDGGPMIITTVNGYVATMMWGDPAYVVPARGFLRCQS